MSGEALTPLRQDPGNLTAPPGAGKQNKNQQKASILKASDETSPPPLRHADASLGPLDYGASGTRLRPAEMVRLHEDQGWLQVATKNLRSCSLPVPTGKCF